MARHRAGFESFVRQVHRRFILLRLLEQTGLGVLAGCAAGLPLATIALWRDLPAAPLAASALLSGAAAGLFRGWITRPNRLRAALEADRQLDAADLLSSAMTIRDPADPWAASLCAAADQWSRSASPSDVILSRLGARAWGGIGLATMLLLVLAFLPTYANPSHAADRTSPTSVALTDAQIEAQISASNGSAHRTPTQQEPEDLRNTAGSADDRTARPNSQQPDKPSDSADHHAPSSSDPNGRGTGQNVSRAPASQAPTPASSAPFQNDSQGRAASGVGQSVAGKAPGAAGGQTVAPSQPLTPLPPWKSSDWSADVERAHHAVDSGQVPDQYRNVIHAYFDRH